jgi:biopolymer transport protein ExbD
MSVHSENNDDDVIAAVNVVPFVDIALVLLIIFMVTSTAIIRAAIKVDLPKAARAGTETTATINLVVTAQRELLLDGEPVTAEQAAKRIRAQAAADPKLQAVISADKRLPYGEVVTVIDMVKQNGVQTFALNIERLSARGTGS